MGLDGSGLMRLHNAARPSTNREGLVALCDLWRAGGGKLQEFPYFGGAGVNPSRLRPGSGLGLGFGAFLTSFLPLSLLPMGASVTQKGCGGKDQCRGSARSVVYFTYFGIRSPLEEGAECQVFPVPIRRRPVFGW